MRVLDSTIMLNSVRSMLVDRCVREQADKLHEADADAEAIIDVCHHVFPKQGPVVDPGSGSVTLGRSLISDIDTDSLLVVLDRTSTLGGRACLRAILSSPTADPLILAARGDVLARISGILSSPGQLNSVNATLETMKATEQDVAWALRHPHQDGETQALYDMAFFKIWPLRQLNDVPVAVTALNLHRIVVSPLVGLLSPLVYFVIPYMVLRFRVGLEVSLMQYLKLMRASMSAASSVYSPSIQWLSLGFSLLFYFQGIFSSVELASTLCCVCSSIVRRSKRIDLFMQTALKLMQLCKPLGERVTSAFFPDTGRGTSIAPRSGTESMQGKTPMLLTNFGRHLSAFKRLDLGGCTCLMRDVYALDALVSIVASKHALGACDVTFDTVSQSPVFVAKGLCHPCIPVDRAVPNNVSMCVPASCASSSCSALLTGPNAGGKSTLLKAMLLATLMAQTLTIACCTTLSLTPYSHIHSHINVPDVQGSMSLFEAEMDRARESMNVLSRLAPDRFSILIMDEVFSSTNPIEGIAGAFSVAKNLAAHSNVTLVVSTHFLYLKKLSALRNISNQPLFQLVQMPVQMNLDATFTYPYRVLPGVCEQLIALELLRGSGFSEQVIKDALEVKRTLLAPPARQSRKKGACLLRTEPRALLTRDPLTRMPKGSLPHKLP